MKTSKLLCSAALATAILAALPSCKDQEKTTEPAEQTATAEPRQPEPPKPAAPTPEEVTSALTAALGEHPLVTPGSATIEADTANEDGTHSITAQLSTTLREDLFTREDAPAAFNSERMAINESHNRAILPDSVYLMQVGTPTDMLTEEDRATKPLPENLQQLSDALKSLAEAPVYRCVVPAGQQMSLTATLTATRNNDQWEFGAISLDKAPLAPYEANLTRSSLPEGAAIITPEFEEARKAEIREKIAAFNQAAEPCIKGREEQARTHLATLRAQKEEELRRAAEQAEAEARARQEWEERCARFIAKDQKFAGEWTRDNRFGEMTLRITSTNRHDNAIHFIGTIFDTKYPAACLEITGRCDLAQSSDTAQVAIAIHDGQYDPDEATAEVYDAGDSLMALKLSAAGTLEGVMSCLSWKDSPEKAFNIHLSPSGSREANSADKR